MKAQGRPGATVLSTLRPDAPRSILPLIALTLTGVADVITTQTHAEMPYVLSLGLILTIASFGGAIFACFARTDELASAQDQLHHAEKLAAGLFASCATPVEPVLSVKGREDLLVQALVNLITNAVQAVPPGESGLVTISAKSAGRSVILVLMPDGGGERLFEALQSRSPELARRVVFVTGGAPDATRTFLESQPQPVLEKPLDAAGLAATIAKLLAETDVVSPAP